MSRPLNEAVAAIPSARSSDRLIRRWSRDGVPYSARALPSNQLGCAVVRRITDDRGRSWRVRQLESSSGHALLFQCDVPGSRAEVRPTRTPLDSLDDEALIAELVTADD